MQKQLQNRLAKLETANPGATFRSITIRGNSLEEQKSELSRLRAAGSISHNDRCINYEPRKKGQPASEIEELPSWWIGMMLREIDEESRADGFLAKRQP
jgi:hypothetical protein